MAKVLVIDNSGGGIAKDLEIGDGMTIGSFVEERYGDPQDFAARVNREIVQENYLLKGGDRVTVASRKYEGEAWTPTLRDFCRYIESIGFCFHRKGKGDHEIWKSPDGQMLPVNAAKRDKKQTDIACIRRLARIREERFGRTLDRLQKFVVA